MREVTATGKTVEEAVQSALRDLGVDRKEVEVSILEEGKRGFLGLFGQKPAIVKVKVLMNPVEEARKFIVSVIEKMDISATVLVEEKGRNATFHIEGEKIALLIGKRGQTLNSLQYLTQLVANRYSNHYIQVIVDAENYRSKRAETLAQLAEKIAKQAVKLGKEIPLEPMPSYERKIIHAALVHNKKVTTYSVGEDPNRYLVIKPKIR